MSGERIRARAAILGSLALLVGALVALQLSDPEPGLLYLAPALLLLAALAFDRYPGRRLLDSLARSWTPVRRRAARARARRLDSARSFPRGGALLAMALAGRGPPA